MSRDRPAAVFQASRSTARRALLVAALALAALLAAPPAGAVALPGGFQETTAFGGLTEPTVVRFADDGRVFVAEKSGLIKVFDGLGDTTPTVFADLRTEVHNYWDRGLLGMALDPDFPQTPWVYVVYTHDAAIGGTAPRWGSPNVTSDTCPTPPGPVDDGCVVSGRLSRLRAAGSTMIEEDVLIEDWCQQYPSHSIGTVEFDSQGRLYASGGDGASFNWPDWGQDGNPLNPCGDPPTGVGGTQTPPTAEGGALRSQDLRSSSDPAALNGSVIRVNPANGAGAAANPLASSSDPNERRILAEGLRNPFRFTIDGSDEVWIGDVGWSAIEEIDRLPASATTVRNFGWPCYEGGGKPGGYDSANLDICESLYSAGTATTPFFKYRHEEPVVTGESCSTGSSSISGLAFYDGATFPGSYDDALFFGDFSRNCIWVMPNGASGDPNPAAVATFDPGANGPVFLDIGPDGALYYASFHGGVIRRIQYASGNQAPLARITANPTAGPAPLQVKFDATGSTDPNPGDTLSFAWDLDGDGQYDDSNESKPTYTYTTGGLYTASVRVSDQHNATGTASIQIDAGNSPPVPTIVAPTADTHWRVDKTIRFSGTGTDSEDGTLPRRALDWKLDLHHCPSNCHVHSLQSFEDTSHGSFVAPDHEYPSYLELTLTVADSRGIKTSTSVRLDPRTVNLRLVSRPTGLTLVHNSFTGPAPYTRTVIKGSANTLSAPSPQTLGGQSYEFANWSDGGARTHTVTADVAETYKATFRTP